MAIQRLGNQRSPSQLQCGFQLTRSRRSDAGLALQVTQADAQETRWPPDHIQHVARQTKGPARAKN